MTAIQTEPLLGRPGAGLPIIEWAVARYILLPKFFKNTTREEGLAMIGKESRRIVKITREVNPESLNERRLIPRLQGLEDSSRYWSIAMTLQHLLIVGELMQQAIVSLSEGSNNLVRVGTADVKPENTIDSAIIIDRFQAFTDGYLQAVTAAQIDAHPRLTHAHPWFGPLNARQWLLLSAQHERIHRLQIQAIIASL